MARRFTFYGFIAAAIATAVSGVAYLIARLRFAALRDAGEGGAEEVMNAVSATDHSLLMLVVTGLLALAMFLWYFVLKCSDPEEVPP
jgi:hypothetical protein